MLLLSASNVHNVNNYDYPLDTHTHIGQYVHTYPDVSMQIHCKRNTGLLIQHKCVKYWTVLCQNYVFYVVVYPE